MAELKLTQAQKRMVAVLVIGGGALGVRQLRGMVRAARKEQKALCAESITRSAQAAGRGGSASGKEGGGVGRVAVDAQFFKRLLVILRICVPRPWSREALLILGQGVLLVSRTLLTDYIANIEGAAGRELVSQNFTLFVRACTSLAVVGLPVAFVNSGLKYMQKLIELAFQERLTQYLHHRYCSNRAYYAASTLGGLVNPDQRITEDVEKFSYAASELYSHTFKPLLDVILFTRSLAHVMGYKGQFVLYAYYIGVAYVLRAISPPLAQLSAQEASLSGVFRSAHQRLVTSSEEVAYNDPPAGAAEEMILNQHLRRLVRYTGLSSFQRFLQQIADGYFIKYLASATALLVYAAPIYFKDPRARGTQGQLTSDYIRSMRLLQNTSRGVGDLILIYKRVNNLSAHTSRVAELLEQVARLSGEDLEHRELFRRNVSATHMLGIDGNGTSEGASLAPRRLLGDTVRVVRLALNAPDGSRLARELTFEVSRGKSVMLMGPNGCGKSSLFRVLAGLWPLEAGEVTTPDKSSLFYLSQRPYLVAGTLRDQVLYPNPPRAVWQAAKVQERLKFAKISGRRIPDNGQDAELQRCLEAVELEYLLTRGEGWEQIQNWSETLSGGEKQRLAMARLLYHRPHFAMLDECTSAVSADGEVKLYQECQKAGITCLSIAHRPALKKFHSAVIHFGGGEAKGDQGWWIETLDPAAADSAADGCVASQAPTENGGH